MVVVSGGAEESMSVRRFVGSIIEVAEFEDWV